MLSCKYFVFRMLFFSQRRQVGLVIFLGNSLNDDKIKNPALFPKQDLFELVSS